MKISKANKTKLENLGLTVLELTGRAIISKKTGLPGNNLPEPITSIPVINVETSEKVSHELACPEIIFWLKDDRYELICWNWVPGPGPGDFDLDFDDEDDAIKFIISYYFEKNEYFDARRLYEENRILNKNK